MTAEVRLGEPPARPASPWLPQLARITEIREEIAQVATYELAFDDARAAEAYQFAPGQFNMIYLPGFGEAALSVSSDPERRGTLWHTVRMAGNVTGALARSRVGDQVGVRGPFGSAWPVEACRGRDVVIACGGIGLAPLRPVLCHIAAHREAFGRVFLLYGARRPRELLYTREYELWRDADIQIEVTVDQGDAGWQGDIGVVPALFYRLRLSATDTVVFTCGPEIMMRFVVFEAMARRIRLQDIYMSMERNMQCAVGFCGHCQLGPAFVCKDGPVFCYQQIEPYLRLDDL